MNNKIIIAGGTGALGTSIIKRYYASDTRIIVFTRNPKGNDKNITYTKWDAKTLGSWADELEGSTAVINLVGKSVNCRYTSRNKREILESRVNATTVIGHAIQKCGQPPKVWINAGSAAIFGNSGDVVKSESSVIGEGFSPDVCKRWEYAFNEAHTPYTRKVFLRIGMVLQQEKGVLRPFINLVKAGFGGVIGTGSQYITWIHEDDFTGIIEWVLRNDHVDGVLHCSSPFPVQNKEFMKTLRLSLNVRIGLPNPTFLVKVGAVLIGTEAELVLSGRKVISKVLKQSNFEFRYPKLGDAISDLVALSHPVSSLSMEKV